MNIVTLTLNPCIDRTLYVSKFEKAALNRVINRLDSPGSKGINVSRVFRLWGVDAIATGFAGGHSGRQLCAFLDSEGVRHRFIETAAETRTNYKIVDLSDESYTEVNEKGGPIEQSELEALIKQLDRLLEPGSCLFLGGSIPPGVPKDIYETLILRYAPKNVRIVLDCDGEALTRGLERRPYIIKPNADELSTLARRKIDDIADAASVANGIFSKYGVLILATLGKKGAVFACRDGVFAVNAPTVRSKGAAGAGDTFLTTFLHMFWSGKGIEYALKAAASAASARVELEGTEMPQSGALLKYFDEAKVEKLI